MQMKCWRQWKVKRKLKKLDVDFEIVDDPEEILRIAKNFGYKEKK